MPVAEPFIKSDEFNDTTPKGELKRRLGQRLQNLRRTQADFLKTRDNYQNSADNVQKDIDAFFLEVENCMTEDDVRKLCKKVGV